MIRSAVFALLIALAPGAVRPDAAQPALAAIDALRASAESLAAAEDARDRVAALTETIRAYEAGLSALREGIRSAALRERAIKAEFAKNEAQLRSLLGALLTMQSSPETLALLHPSGPIDSARAAMLIADVSPAIAAEAERLRLALQEMDTLRVLQSNAAITLERGLSDVQQARTSLGQAISDRAPAPDASRTDAATMQALVNSADTLQGFAETLTTPGEGDGPALAPAFSDRKGNLPLPVAGRILTAFDEPDAQGVRRSGIQIAAEAQALVTAPHAATLRYAGPLLDLGQVAILETEPGTLLVLAGLGTTFGRPGDILEEGAPVGFMDGAIPAGDQILIETARGGGQDRSETLYIELRQDQTPRDPADWFDVAIE